jgi:methyltransferase
MTASDLLAHPATALAIVLVLLAGEAYLSAQHERWLRGRGAVEPRGDVYRWMQVVYPAGFLACIMEGWWRGSRWTVAAAGGLAIFACSKLIKYTAMATLGRRWTFRVLPLPDARPVASGVYRWVRHPNYVAVLGEILGMALWMQAPLAGLAFGLTFLWIFSRRIPLEERALAAAVRR